MTKSQNLTIANGKIIDLSEPKAEIKITRK